ncbi:MAG: aquaporin [Bacteroidota bacterium]|nr:aquaporin [Bacteroidota bacterium]
MKKYLAELIGTFSLVFCGTGAIVINEVTNGTIGHIGIALSFGLVVTIMIYAIGNISGSHINPAVSFVLYTEKQLPLNDLLGYVGSQTIGALLASLSLRCLFPSSVHLGATLPTSSEIQSFSIEIFLAFMLMFVIDRVKSQTHLAGIIIGAVVALEALFAGPITGASMNPVRSLAPALVSGNLQSLWVYLFAPFIGMYLGSKMSRYFT